MYSVTKGATGGLLKPLFACLCLIGWANRVTALPAETGNLTHTGSPPSQVTVQKGETAYRIARRYKSEAVTMDQMLLALLRENPGVFQAGSLHRIRAGSVLVIPSHPAVHKTSPVEASQIVQGQNRRVFGEGLRVGAKVAVADSVQPKGAPPNVSSVRSLAETDRSEAVPIPAIPRPDFHQNVAMSVPKEASARSLSRVWMGLLLMGGVMLLFLNRSRIQDRLRRRQPLSTFNQPRSESLDRRIPSILKIMVGIRDFNRHMRLEINTWINSQNPTSPAVAPSATEWTPSISVLQGSGFQQIAQSDWVVLQKHTPVSCLIETDIEVRFLGNGFHLDFEFPHHKPEDAILDTLPSGAGGPTAAGISEIHSHTHRSSSPPTTFQRSKSMKQSGFSFSPAEYLANQQIQMMSLEEEGVYIRLLSYCWQNGSVPKDPEQAARLVGKGASTTVVASVLRLFQATQNPQELTHSDLQRQRDRLAHWKEKSAAGGRKSAASRKGGSTTLETVVEKSLAITGADTQKAPTRGSSLQKLPAPPPPEVVSEAPELDSEASQEAFERYAIAVGLLATDGAFLHRQWRSKDSELRTGWPSGWRQLLTTWRDQGRFPSQASNLGGGRISEKERIASPLTTKTGTTAVIPPQLSRDFPKFAASQTPYSFRFDGFQTAAGL
jgi:FimV-like protein